MLLSAAPMNLPLRTKIIFAASCVAFMLCIGSATKYILQQRRAPLIKKDDELSQGVRLVYSIDIDKAISEERDRYVDDILQKIITQLGIRREESKELDEPVSAVNDEKLAPSQIDEFIKQLMPTRSNADKLSQYVNIKRFVSNTVVFEFVNLTDVNTIKRNNLFAEFENNFSIRWTSSLQAELKIHPHVEETLRKNIQNRTKEVIETRFEQSGIHGVILAMPGENILSISIPKSVDQKIPEIQSIVAQRAKLEFKLTDDKHDFIGSIYPARASEYALPEFASIQEETVTIGASVSGSTRHSQVHFVRIDYKPNETQIDAIKRAKSWIDSLPVPNDHQVALGEFEEYKENGASKAVGLRTYYLYRKADMAGEYIANAEVSLDPYRKVNHYVNITFTPIGTERFKQLTQTNIKKRLAIVIDEYVNSAPIIQSEISNGRAQITFGSYANQQEQIDVVKQLALLLKAGMLPAPVKLLAIENVSSK